MAPPMKPSREEMLAVTMNQKLAKQGAKTRKLAEARDVNTMPDPKTYATVMGLLGERPDEMGFSVAHPKYKEIMDVADPAFALGTAAQVVPLVKPAGQAVRGAAKALAPKAGQMVMKAAEVGGMPVQGLGVVKPEGGNWLGGNLMGSMDRSIERLTPTNDLSANIKVMKARLESLKNSGASEREIRNLERDILENEKDQAVNNWVKSNLGKYGKNQMATPSDPVRLLFEKRTQNAEAALARSNERAASMRERAQAEPDERRRNNMLNNAAQLEAKAKDEYDLAMEHVMHTGIRPESSAKDLALERVAAGFPGKGMGQSKAAKNWEGASDEAIKAYNAGRIQEAMKSMPVVQAAERALLDYEIELNKKFNDWLDTHNFTDKQLAAMSKMNMAERAALINDTKYEQLQKDYNQARMMINGPEWHYGQQNKWTEKLDPSTTLYSGSLDDLGFDHVIDILRQDVREGRIRPDQLNKVTVDQAVQRAADFNLAQAKKSSEVDASLIEGMPVHKEYPEGYKWIELAPPKELPSGYSVVKDDMTGGFKVVDANGKEAVNRSANNLGHINIPFHKTEEEAIAEALKYDKRLEEALKYEGDVMGHCVGGYCPDVLSGAARIYSLRDPQGMSRATIEVRPNRASMSPSDFYHSKEVPPSLLEKINKAEEAGDLDDIGSLDDFVLASPEYQAYLKTAKPPIIQQIKGSGKKDPSQQLRHAGTGYPDNPDAHLLPFVHDFVQSGNWSAVRDLENAGLVDTNYLPSKYKKLADYIDYKRTGRFFPQSELDEQLGLMDDGYAGGGEVKATPVKNKAAHGMSQALGAVHKFASEPFGYKNPPGEMISEMLGIPATARTLERMGYGEPLTTGKGMTAKPKADTMDALMAVAPLVPITKGTPVGAIIKPKGGNWMTGSIEKRLEPLRYPTVAGETPAQRIPKHEKLLQDQSLSSESRATVERHLNEEKKRAALDKWVDSNLTNYIKNQLATEDDPIRKLAEQGITHKADLHDTRRSPGAALMRRRYDAGYPQEGVAQSGIAKAWENMSDYAVGSKSAKELTDPAHMEDIMPVYRQLQAETNLKENPWLSKVDPETRIYKTNPMVAELGFDHIVDILREDLLSGRIRPEQLSKMSIEQAVRRTYQYDIEAARNAQKAQLDAMKANLSQTPHKEYPSGYKWVKLPDPAESPENMKVVKDIGCQGGWCTQQESNALSYGRQSEGNALHVLLDPTGRPHIQIHSEKRNHPISSGGKHGEFPKREWTSYGKYESDPSMKISEEKMDEIYNRAKEMRAKGGWNTDAQDYLQMAADEILGELPRNITQIKPFSNYWESQMVQDFTAKNPNYRQELEPYIQDFVRSGKWGEIKDLKNTGLEQYGPHYFNAQEAEAHYKPLVQDALNFLETHPSIERHRAARKARNDFKGDTTSQEYRDLERQAGESIAPGVPYTYAELKALLSSPEDWAERGETIYRPISTAVEQIEKAKKALGPAEGMKAGGEVKMDKGGDAKKKVIDDFWKGMKESVPQRSELGPLDMLKQNLEAAYEGAKKVPGNLYKLATDPVGYAKSLPAPTGDQIINAFGPADMGFVGSYRPSTPLKPDPTVGTRYKVTDQGGLVPRQNLDIEQLQGSQAKIFPWDATSRNKLVTEVSEVPLKKPVLTEGGDEYMMDVQHVKNRIAGASNEGIANRILDRIDQAAWENRQLGGTGKVYGFPVRMGEGAEFFSTFPADIVMDFIGQGALNKKELAALTKDLRTMNFLGKKAPLAGAAPVGTPEFEMQLREGVKKGKNTPAVTPGNLRKGLMNRLGMVEYQERMGYNLPDLQGAVIAENLKGVPKGYVGNVVAELDPGAKLRPSKSSSYSHDFSGQYAGSMPNQPVEFLMPNTYEVIYREMKKEYPDASQTALRNMTIGAMEKRKESISELIGQRSIDAVKTYQEGLRKGEFDPNNIQQVYDYMRRKKLELKLKKGGPVETKSGLLKVKRKK